MVKTLLIIGGTGAQGAAVVRYLASTNDYHILVSTRDTTSSRAAALAELRNVELVANKSEHGYDLAAFEASATQADYVFVNTDGFALGEQAETHWGILLYERSVRAGVKHFVYSGLDNVGPDTNYAAQFHTGHYAGKARVQEFIKSQPTSPMAWSIIRSGPYIEMLSEALSPHPAGTSDDTVAYNLALGDGAIPFIHLDDFARYVHWAFSRPSESVGLDLAVGTVHAGGADIVAAYSAVTGKPAIYRDIPAAAWSAKAFPQLPQGHDTKIGWTKGGDDSMLNQTFKENFAGWWTMYRASKGNQGLIQRDYELLDRILPDRVKTVEEWMRKVQYTGKRMLLLKSNDGRTDV